MVSLGRAPATRRDSAADEQRAAADYYRRRLREPAVRPWTDDHPLKPITLGPTWEIGKDGRWVLPELTLGWEVLGFLSTWLNPAAIGRRDRYEFTLEQARILLHWYAVEPDATWVYRDGVLQRVKGHGKDPFIAALATNVLVGPDEPVEVDERTGVVRGEQAHNPLVQLAAVSLDQTKTTMKLFPSLWTDEFRHRFGIMPPAKLGLDARGGQATLDALTSSPAKLEGFRARLALANETHHWKEANGGLEMDAVLRRNMRKNAQARVFRTTNAFAPGEESVAEKDRRMADGDKPGRMFYDTVEAPREARLDREHGEQVVPMVRGDSVWLTVDMFVEALEDERDADSVKRRFWYNQVQASEESWIDPLSWKAAGPQRDPQTGDLLTQMLMPGDKIVLFGDGSKSDDATALMACRVEDGALFTIGVWQRPKGLPKDQHAAWRVDRDDVDRLVASTFGSYKVLGFFFDPSDVLDDSGSSYWTPYCDAWHQRYSKKMPLWATKGKHAVVFDMRSPVIQKLFTEAAQQFVNDVERRDFEHDGDPRLRRHVENARKAPNKHGVSLQKESRESAKKIDLAVCSVGARLMRRVVVNGGRKMAGRSGRVV